MKPDNVTLGIVSFNRPDHLRRLLASIERHYPSARIDIAENGLTGWWDHTLVSSDAGRRVFLLPYDAGCSAARNTLIDNCKTDYLLFLEEDFVFTEQTAIEPLVDILESDSEVGLAAGYVDPGGKPNITEGRQTPGGTRYGIAAAGVRLFAVGRQRLFQEHRFPEVLKTGEHGPWMSDVIRAGKWKTAFCDSTSILHESGLADPEYKAMRGRAKQFKDDWDKVQAIRDYLLLKKTPNTRSQFGKCGYCSFGHGDQLFLDFILCKRKWRHCVELGTGSGLTTIYLAVAFGLRGGDVWTCDIRRKPSSTFHDHFPLNVEFQQIDILTEKCFAVVAELSKPNTFAFFDNGKKRQEVAMYAEHLQPGSALMVHDWPREFGPDDEPALLAKGFEPFHPARAEMMQSCCRCYIRSEP